MLSLPNQGGHLHGCSSEGGQGRVDAGFLLFYQAHVSKARQYQGQHGKVILFSGSLQQGPDLGEALGSNGLRTYQAMPAGPHLRAVWLW